MCTSLYSLQKQTEYIYINWLRHAQFGQFNPQHLYSHKGTTVHFYIPE
jgi:hypothetical protein